MILVRLYRRAGAVTKAEAEGHAGWAASGADIVCAAASALLRSAARALGSRWGENVRFEAPHPGSLRLELLESDEWTSGVWAMLETGLRDLQREFPQSVRVEIQDLR